MAGVSGAGRAVAWGVAVVAGAVALGLIAIAVLVDMDTADRAASLAGAVAGLVALVVAVVTLVRPGGPGGSGAGSRLRAGRGGIVAGGDISDNAIGRGSRVTSSSPRRRPAPSQPGRTDLRVGRDGIGAAGDIRGNAIGDESERR
ncbi:hypothetical protein R2B67_12380 [Streptomyces cyaneofuscatus]|uniref:hypothetical protein n=1 Tax=Streptomyces cyaneofuscatus TaxID=66883 RepID=UPI002953CF26|nr:hypothetical protein [Streptomyces cyaneofuscatus]WOP09320.1 hypothetical protein R2B67_12380 [Streptomyces cyaneofuscatus]